MLWVLDSVRAWSLANDGAMVLALGAAIPTHPAVCQAASRLCSHAAGDLLGIVSVHFTYCMPAELYLGNIDPATDPCRGVPARLCRLPHAPRTPSSQDSEPRIPDSPDIPDSQQARPTMPLCRHCCIHVCPEQIEQTVVL